MSQLINAPTRMAAPPEFLEQPKLELLEQPLYSTIGFDAAVLPRQVIAFKYALGGQVAGAGAGAIAAATEFHTNMEQPGALPAPTVFSVTGLRAVLNQLQWDTLPPTLQPTFLQQAPSVAAAPFLLDDLLTIHTAGTAFRLVVGPKSYANVPLSLIPGNAGVGGVASVTNDQETVAATTTVRTLQRFNALHWAGSHYNHHPYRVLIPTQQTFFAEFTARVGLATVTLRQDRLLTFVLEGASGREVL